MTDKERFFLEEMRREIQKKIRATEVDFDDGRGYEDFIELAQRQLEGAIIIFPYMIEDEPNGVTAVADAYENLVRDKLVEVEDD